MLCCYGNNWDWIESTCGGQNNQSHWHFDQNKLRLTNTASISNTGFQCFDGIWMKFCRKCLSWCVNTTHFHVTALLARTSHSLLSTHPFHYICSSTSTSSISNQTESSVSVLNTIVSVPGGNSLNQSSSPLHFSNFYSWFRYCSPCWCSWQSIGVILAEYWISSCYKPCLPNSYSPFLNLDGLIGVSLNLHFLHHLSH